MSEELLRRRVFKDFTAVEKTDTIRDITSKPHLMRNNEHSHPLILEVTDNRENIANKLGIQCGGYLIKHEYIRAICHGPDNCNPLLLAA
jgi:hypothetical protein